MPPENLYLITCYREAKIVYQLYFTPGGDFDSGPSLFGPGCPPFDRFTIQHIVTVSKDA